MAIFGKMISFLKTPKISNFGNNGKFRKKQQILAIMANFEKNSKLWKKRQILAQMANRFILSELQNFLIMANYEVFAKIVDLFKNCNFLKNDKFLTLSDHVF